MGRLGSHPSIVTIHDMGEHEGQPYLVTDFMEGGDVERLIAEAPVECLDEGVVRRLPRSTEIKLNTIQVCPLILCSCER